MGGERAAYTYITRQIARGMNRSEQWKPEDLLENHDL